MKKRFLCIVFIIYSFTSIFSPVFAASDHQNGQIRVRWTTNDLYLNSNSYIEQEFIPTVNTALIDGNGFRWSSQYHIDFCWNDNGTLSSSGPKCGYAGFGLGSRVGNNYYGNFDFALFNAIDFQKISNDPQINCSNSADAGLINNTKTFYMNCWRSVVVQMGTPYVLRVQNESSSNSTDSNWWSATLRNKNTNETILIGKIQAFANDYKSQLSLLETVVFYQGDPVSCDKVPIMDLRVAPFKSSTKSSSMKNYWTANCVNAAAIESTDYPGYVSIRLGGSDPKSRESQKPSTVSTPKPIETFSSAKKFMTSTKVIPPELSAINISGNTINIKVNIGNITPDVVYLISPKLFGEESQKVKGEIKGNAAFWSFVVDPKLAMGSIPISFYSVKGDLISKESRVIYSPPSASPKPSTVKKPTTFNSSKPKTPLYSQNNPNSSTVICIKGPNIRTFAGKNCPPGWKAK